MSGLSIISILSYLFAIECCNKYGAKPIFCSIVAVILPLFLNALVGYLIIKNIQSAIEMVLMQTGIFVIVLQFVASFFVFTKLQDTDSIPSMLGWSTGGALLILLIIPLVL